MLEEDLYCAACDQSITDEVVEALGKNWHPHHFICNHCGGELDYFYENAGKLYCRKHYRKFFAPLCAFCHEHIDGDRISALGKKWHPDHLRCSQCDKQLVEHADGKLIRHRIYKCDDGKPYCGQCRDEIVPPRTRKLGITHHHHEYAGIDQPSSKHHQGIKRQVSREVAETTVRPTLQNTKSVYTSTSFDAGVSSHEISCIAEENQVDSSFSSKTIQITDEIHNALTDDTVHQIPCHSSSRFTFDKNDVIGAGAFGIVYKGKDTATDVLVAVKLLHDDVEATKEMAMVKLLEYVSHPNIINTLHVGDLEVVMEYCHFSLTSYVANHGTPGLQHTDHQLLTQQLASGYKALYNHDILHRDIKPDNVLGKQMKDGSIQWKLADIGVGRVLERTFASTACGTPGYMAPEVLMTAGKNRNNTYDHRADIWSIGLVLYIAFSGDTAPPVTTDYTFQMIRAKTVAELPNLKLEALPRMDENLSNLITRMLEKDFTKRINIILFLAHQYLKNDLATAFNKLNVRKTKKNHKSNRFQISPVSDEVLLQDESSDADASDSDYDSSGIIHQVSL